MASRFTQRQGIQSNYVEKFYQPNFELLAKVLEKNQGDYNMFEEVNSKQANYMDVDSEAAKQHMAQKQANMQSITDAYIQGGVQKGNIARKQGMRDLRADWQQGGKSYGLQQNYDNELQYIAEQKARYNSGLITRDTYDAALKYSKNQFAGSFNEDGTFNKFSGYETAEDLDIASEIDNKLKGYISETMGRKVGKMLNGDYYYIDTMEGIPRQEILDATDHIVKTDPRIRAYLDQQDLIFDQRDPTLLNSEVAINNARTFLANKWDGIKSNRQLITNWRAQEELRDRKARARTKDEKSTIPYGDRGTKRSAPYNLTSGLRKVEGNEGVNRRIQQLQKEKLEIKGYSVSPGSTQTNRNLSEKEQAKIAKLDEQISALKKGSAPSHEENLRFYTTPKGRELYPVMARTIDDNPRKKVVDPAFYGISGEMAQRVGFDITRLENDKEYLERMTKSSNAIIDHLSQVATSVIPLSKEGYANFYNMHITQGKLLGMSGSHIDPAMGPSPGMNIKQLVIDAGGIINGVDADKATDKDWNEWLKTSVAANGYTIPGPMASNNAYDLSTGMELTLNIGEDKAPMKVLLDDATDEQNRMAKETQRAATAMFAPHETKSEVFGALPLWEYNPESETNPNAPQYIKAENNERGWSYGSTVVPGLEEVVMRVHPGIYEDPSLEPIVYQIMKDERGNPIGIKQAVSVFKDEDGNFLKAVAPSYSEIIKTRAMMDRNSTYYTKQEK